MFIFPADNVPDGLYGAGGARGRDRGLAVVREAPVLGLADAPGLSDCLAGNSTLDTATQRMDEGGEEDTEEAQD